MNEIYWLDIIKQTQNKPKHSDMHKENKIIK